jgi:DNA-binding response OmpR family regulator
LWLFLWYKPVLKMPSSIRRILYIEDDADTRELISFLLRQENYEVVVAESPEQSLELAQTMPFDLYMLDNWMPGASGIDLCKKLRSFDSNTPILFYSGAAYDRDKHEAFAAGAQGYLTKPTDNDALVQEVSRLISEARGRNIAANSVLSKRAVI